MITKRQQRIRITVKIYLRGSESLDRDGSSSSRKIDVSRIVLTFGNQLCYLGYTNNFLDNCLAKHNDEKVSIEEGQYYELFISTRERSIVVYPKIFSQYLLSGLYRDLECFLSQKINPTFMYFTTIANYDFFFQ